MTNRIVWLLWLVDGWSERRGCSLRDILAMVCLDGVIWHVSHSVPSRAIFARNLFSLQRTTNDFGKFAGKMSTSSSRLKEEEKKEAHVSGPFVPV